jgi:hypothetical protein
MAEHKFKVKINDEDYKLLLKNKDDKIISTIYKNDFDYYIFEKENDKTKLHERLIAALERRDGFDYDIKLYDDEVTLNITNSYLIANEKIVYELIKQTPENMNEKLIKKLFQRLKMYENPVQERIYFKKDDASVGFYNGITKYLTEKVPEYYDFMSELRTGKINFDDVKMEYDIKSSFDMIRMFIIYDIKNKFNATCHVNDVIKLLFEKKLLNCTHNSYKSMCDNCSSKIKSMFTYKCKSSYDKSYGSCLDYLFWKEQGNGNGYKYDEILNCKSAENHYCHYIKQNIVHTLINLKYYELMFNSLSLQGYHPFDFTNDFSSGFIKCVYDDTVLYNYNFEFAYVINNQYYNVLTLEPIKKKPYYVSVKYESLNIIQSSEVQCGQLYKQIFIYREEC